VERSVVDDGLFGSVASAGVEALLWLIQEEITIFEAENHKGIVCGYLDLVLVHERGRDRGLIGLGQVGGRVSMNLMRVGVGVRVAKGVGVLVGVGG